MLLKCFAYPCRYSDMVPWFTCPVPVLSMITNKALDYIYTVHSHRIVDWNPAVLNHQHCKTMPKLSPKEGHHCRTVLVFLVEQLGLLRGLIIIRELSTTVINECML